MAFLYFAYGSNLWPPQIRGRCPSARPVATGVVRGWEPVYDKPSTDGSAKLNLRPSAEAQTQGAVYEIADEERPLLDEAEPGYTPFTVTVATAEGEELEALTYRWEREGTDAPAYDWYVAMVRRGARHHGLAGDGDASRLAVDARPDPLAPDSSPPDTPAPAG